MGAAVSVGFDDLESCVYALTQPAVLLQDVEGGALECIGGTPIVEHLENLVEPRFLKGSGEATNETDIQFILHNLVGEVFSDPFRGKTFEIFFDQSEVGLRAAVGEQDFGGPPEGGHKLVRILDALEIDMELGIECSSGFEELPEVLLGYRSWCLGEKEIEDGARIAVLAQNAEGLRATLPPGIVEKVVRVAFGQGAERLAKVRSWPGAILKMLEQADWIVLGPIPQDPKLDPTARFGIDRFAGQGSKEGEGRG